MPPFLMFEYSIVILSFALLVSLSLVVVLLVLYLRTRRRLRNREFKVQRLKKQRTDFVANVSHELKTPLTSIRGFTETLRAGALDDREKADQFLRRIEDNAERLDQLIHDILELSKLEATDTHLQVTRFSVAELLEKIKEEYAMRLEKKSQVLSIDNQVESLSADQELVRQVFSNLVGNANRYCPEGAIIEIKGQNVYRSGRAWYYFNIADNGPGIPADDLPRIFERFYRADKSRNRAFGGTGLGLSIVKHVVLSHGGRVHAVNREKGGLEFQIYFPVSSS